jgi:hypothetical protein
MLHGSKTVGWLLVSTEVTLLERTKRVMMDDRGTMEIYLFSTASSP